MQLVSCSAALSCMIQVHILTLIALMIPFFLIFNINYFFHPDVLVLLDLCTNQHRSHLSHHSSSSSPQEQRVQCDRGKFCVVCHGFVRKLKGISAFPLHVQGITWCIILLFPVFKLEMFSETLNYATKFSAF